MYRGRTNKVEDVIYPGRAELYALLPYEVRGLRLRVSLSDCVLTVEAEVMPDDPQAALVTHVFHIKVVDPRGRVRPELTRNVVSKAGRLRERVFLGYNAPAGVWRVAVRDVATGTADTSTIAVSQ
jgi:hypothetical protein